MVQSSLLFVMIAGPKSQRSNSLARNWALFGCAILALLVRGLVASIVVIICM
jgi:hypothetical protein